MEGNQGHQPGVASLACPRLIVPFRILRTEAFNPSLNALSLLILVGPQNLLKE